MPEPQKHTSVTESKPEPKAGPASALGNAGEASDPAVHDALARLAIARSNRETLEVAAADVKAADEAVKAAEKVLADLGYQA